MKLSKQTLVPVSKYIRSKANNRTLSLVSDSIYMGSGLIESRITIGNIRDAIRHESNWNFFKKLTGQKS